MPTSQETAPDLGDDIKRELSELFGDFFSFEVSDKSTYYRISIKPEKPGSPVIHLVYNSITNQIYFENFTGSDENAIIDQENSIGIILHIRYIFLTSLIKRVLNQGFDFGRFEYTDQGLNHHEDNNEDKKFYASGLEQQFMCLFLFCCSGTSYLKIFSIGIATFLDVINRIIQIYTEVFPDRDIKDIIMYLSTKNHVLGLVKTLSLGVNGSILTDGREIIQSDLEFSHDNSTDRLTEIKVKRNKRTLRLILSFCLIEYDFSTLTDEQAGQVIEIFKNNSGAESDHPFSKLISYLRDALNNAKSKLSNIKIENFTASILVYDIQKYLWTISVLSPDSTPPVAACPARGARLPEGGLFEIIAGKIAEAFAKHLGCES